MHGLSCRLPVKPAIESEHGEVRSVLIGEVIGLTSEGEGPTASHVGLTSEDEDMLAGSSVGRGEESGEGEGEGEGDREEEGKEKEERGGEKESWDQPSHLSLPFSLFPFLLNLTSIFFSFLDYHFCT